MQKKDSFFRPLCATCSNFLLHGALCKLTLQYVTVYVTNVRRGLVADPLIQRTLPNGIARLPSPQGCNVLRVFNALLQHA